MLVLGRKNQESVILAAEDGVVGKVKVTVVEIGRGVVKLGFEADKDVLVHREEVWERISRERLRDLPAGDPDRAVSSNANEKAAVLIGTAKGRRPKS